jgi:hypothetical protein
MILAQVRDEMNAVNRYLDEYEAAHSRGRRKELLQMAVTASIRGLGALSEEAWTRDPVSQQALIGIPSQELRVLLEGMRQDSALLRAFVIAECRLLADLGVRPASVEQVRRSLERTLEAMTTAEPVPPDSVAELLTQLDRDLAGLAAAGHDGNVIGRLAGVVLAMGGGLLVGANATVGTGLAPVTGGISAAGAAVSVAAGTDMFSRGVTRALTAD